MNEFCYHCEQKWINPDPKDRTKCGNKNCRELLHLAIEALKAGKLVTIDDLHVNVPEFRTCPRKDCLTKFGYRVVGHHERCKHVCCENCKREFCFVCLAQKRYWTNCKRSYRPSSCGDNLTKCKVAPVQTIRDLQV